MAYPLPDNIRLALFQFIVRMGDDNLILGHRLSEWCGHGPILEEDIALANIALDCIGQANALLALAGEVEGKGRTEDDLAYLRNECQFRNLLLVEEPNVDFAFSITRQFFYDTFASIYFEELIKSTFGPLSGIASKAVKEISYHLRHARTWMLRLGDGTEESHSKTQDAVDALWRFTDELFYNDEIDRLLISEGIIPDPALLHNQWQSAVEELLTEATLEIPKDVFMQMGGRTRRHSEYLGHLLAEMQIVARSYPGATW